MKKYLLMNSVDNTLLDRLHSLLAQAPALSAAQLQAATGKSQPSISLALQALGHRVCKLGAARSTRYALTQPIFGLPAQQSLYWTGDDGVVQAFGNLSFLHNGDVHVRSAAPQRPSLPTALQRPDLPASPATQARGEWLGNKGLPWFLAGLRPQGFLGRQYTALRPDFPSDPDAWTTEQVLYIAANHATDPPGALELGTRRSAPAGASRGNVASSLGAPSGEFGGGVSGALGSGLLNSTDPLLPTHYDALAAQTGTRLPAGSSAGGEQPKFVVRLQTSLQSSAWQAAQENAPSQPPATQQHIHAIVKYTPPRGTPFGERWHDLLHLEHLANEVLRSHGIACAHTRVVESAQRSYLESQRFDRVGAAGKRHVVAASAVHDAFVHAPRLHWVATCEALVALKLLPLEDLRQVALIYHLGHYIGNTDMHFGNLSFFVADVLKPQFRITPVYDMLPMQWRPSIHTGTLDAQPIRPQHLPAGYASEAALAREWALDYWQRAEALGSISAQLRAVCAVNVQRLQSNFAGFDRALDFARI